jgi:hypothetical protein
MMATANDQSELSRGFYSRMGGKLASPWVTTIAVGVALLLTVLSVQNGLILDDLFHRAVLNGSTQYGEYLPEPQGMFQFFSGDPEAARARMDVGLLPWFVDPNMKANFCQVISTQTHILDYWLWPDRPELMHLHNLLWFALLVFLAAKFYRRILGPTWMAGLAALLFAVEDGHALPAGWICNRNALIAATFGFGCLIAHDAWRRENRNSMLPVALLLWVLSLFSKEAGVATCAYVFAYALWMDQSTLWRRFLTLVPYGLLLIIWALVRGSLGYGVANLGFYVDPIQEPARFVTGLLERYPVLLYGQWFAMSEISLIFEAILRWPFWPIALAYVSLLALLFWPVLRRDRIARFFATGMLLAVIPICATMPMDRLLMFVGLGAFGLLVRFWYAVFVTDGPRPDSALWRAVAKPVAVFLILIHIVLAPVLLTARSAAPWGPKGFVDAMFVNIPFDETIENQDLIVVNMPYAIVQMHSLLKHEHEGMPIPRALRVLAPSIAEVTVKRIDDRTLEVESGAYLVLADRIVRNEEHPLKIGETVTLSRMTATVLSVTEDQRPERVAFRFEVPLEDSSLRWLCWKNGEYVPWTPPKVGDEITLKAG